MCIKKPNTINTSKYIVKLLKVVNIYNILCFIQHQLLSECKRSNFI